ncbi:MAG TPA: hypothetical protein VN809_15080 [Telmatospirillum sp.]|nr:hypothetical protein [Telmatospirillum sp.]
MTKSAPFEVPVHRFVSGFGQFVFGGAKLDFFGDVLQQEIGGIGGR